MNGIDLATRPMTVLTTYRLQESAHSLTRLIRPSERLTYTAYSEKEPTVGLLYFVRGFNKFNRFVVSDIAKVMQNC